ncbi:ScbR family autoregulator-binding transcription factor [Streptomyces sp. CSDS2]|uniref:ScbR family autoregulator-binding transcription factor n=1 Tax=Streptomyces sp. CSDS2 TaxID=3055051 RepID=UPI0025B23F98|nr:ScbR family autoregulator-binding transcription factor [Streptomyces sp. CSDS2]MDN3262850.1 ScbR family autoregulator-binding transcription factor [Streptomyces sp. CSDS2]
MAVRRHLTPGSEDHVRDRSSAKQARALRTRHALIRSAAAAFEGNGYAEATLSLISSGAGVSPGALHFHFENKAAVAEAVERAAADTFRSLSRQIDDTRDSALQALIDTSHMLARALATDVVVRAAFQLCDEPGYTAVVGLRADWLRRVRSLLGEAAGEGALLPGLGLRRATTLVVAALTGFEVLGKGDPEWISGGSLADFWETTLPCLAAAPALRGLEPTGVFLRAPEPLALCPRTRGGGGLAVREGPET